MKIFQQKSRIQKFEDVRQFVEEYQLGKDDFILASKSIYERYFAPLSLEAHVVYKSQYGKGEPTDAMVDGLMEDFAKTQCKRIVAIGGGAVIDMAKILVLEGTYKTEDIFLRKVPLKKARPLIAVPTTCGAGSEVSNVSIAELTNLHTKLGLAVDEIYADEAVLIPELLRELPYSFFATSAIDAFIHAIESYVSPKANLYTEMFSMKAMEMIVGGFRKMAEHGKEYRMELLLEEKESGESQPESVEALLDTVDNEELLQILLSTDKKTLQMVVMKMMGYAPKEISHHMELPEQTIYTRLRRLREKIKKSVKVE